MTTPFLTKAVAILLIGAALTAQKTYYVDSVNGKATNGGLTPSNAFGSLTQAVGLVAKGDTVVVLPGTYNISTEGSFPVKFGNTATDQSNITIIALDGPSKTFIDGGGTYSGIGMIRFYEKARGVRLSGFTFRNMADSFWSCGIRLGSTSGNAFRAWDAEIDNCIFASSLSRAFVVFGADAKTKRQTTGLRIHNNLFLNMNQNRRPVAIYGDGVNHFYNNTIIHPTTTTNRAGVYLNALLSHGVPSKAVVKNNIVVGGGGTGTDNSWGIEKGPKTTSFAGGASAVVENNNCFGNKVNYSGFVPSATNLKVDPKLVSKTDQHLQSTSPMINKGTTNVALIRHDLDGYPQRNGNSDIGAYEYHTNSFGLSILPKIAGSVEFEFKGSGGIAYIYVAFNESSFYLPTIGQGLIDPSLFALVTTTSSPGKLKLSVPNDSKLEGVRVVFQGLYVGTGGAELLNVVHTYIRK